MDSTSSLSKSKLPISAAKAQKKGKANASEYKGSIDDIRIAGTRSSLSEKDLPSRRNSTLSRAASGEHSRHQSIGRGGKICDITKTSRQGQASRDSMSRATDISHMIAYKGGAPQASSADKSSPLKSQNMTVGMEHKIKGSTRTVMPMHEYNIKPIIPAEKAELLDVGRAMHRDQFATRVKKLFDPEREAAIQAIKSGIYIGWRCPGNDFDCIRVSMESRCFCGHVLNQHESFEKKRTTSLKCLLNGCGCKQFAFVPSRPQEIGEWWLPKRRGFDVASWRAKCRCKHDHDQHKPNSNRKCNVKGCLCFAFSSNFLCAACDKHWEEHDTCFDDLASRQEKGLPYGEDYIPFNELPQLRNIVLTGNEDDSSTYEALQSGPYAIPRQQPTQLALQLQGKKP